MNHSVSPDPRFRAWLTERAPRLAPPDLLPRTMATVAAAPQDGRWALRRHLLRFSTPAVVAILVLAAIGAGTLLSRLPDVVVVPSPSPSAAPTVAATPDPTPIVSVAPSPTPPATTAQPSPTTGPAPTLPPALAFQQWARHDMPDPAPDTFGGGTPIGVVRVGDGFLAIGQEVGSGGLGGERVARWTSSDGVSWELAEGLPGLSVRAVSQLVSDGERAVLIGVAGDDFTCCEAAAWVTTDGVAWTLAEGPVPSIATAGPDGFVGALNAGGRVRFVASPDGRTWAPLAGPSAGEVTGLAVDATGRAVAIGHRLVESAVDGSSTTDLLIWRSPDGSTWGEPQTILHDARASAVVAGPRGFVVAGVAYAYGRDGSVREVPQVWRLVGIGLDPAAIELGEGESVDQIVAVGETLVASGQAQIEGVGTVRVWVSSDGGDTWVAVPAQEAFAGIDGDVRSIIAAPGGLVAVGQRWDPQAGHAVPVAWTASR
jgi:hypothetical protein